jgi:Icc-related predicted phosphoesterase
MKKTIVVLLLCISFAGYAQKMKVVQGSLKSLKGATSIKTEFTYDNMIVGKDLTEKEYIAEKKEKYNSKEAGKGDKWEKAWIEDRAARFEPQFRELFAKHSGLTTVGENPKYTLVFHTTRTEPGWNVGVMRASAQIDAEVTIVETKNRNEVIAKVTILKSPGRDAMGYDFETGARLQEAYAKAGKSLGKLIEKELGK